MKASQILTEKSINEKLENSIITIGKNAKMAILKFAVIYFFT
jgi:hypothetical protein